MDSATYSRYPRKLFNFPWCEKGTTNLSRYTWLVFVLFHWKSALLLMCRLLAEEFSELFSFQIAFRDSALSEWLVTGPTPWMCDNKSVLIQPFMKNDVSAVQLLAAGATSVPHCIARGASLTPTFLFYTHYPVGLSSTTIGPGPSNLSTN